MNYLDIVIIAITVFFLASAVYYFLQQVVGLNLVLITIFFACVLISTISYDKGFCVVEKDYVFCDHSSETRQWIHEQIMNSYFSRSSLDAYRNFSPLFGGIGEVNKEQVESFFIDAWNICKNSTNTFIVNFFG
jgi:hypothetical protein